MSNSISTDRLPQVVSPPDEQLTRATVRQPSGESWHRTFEHALGSGFEGWFQAPTDRGDPMPGEARGASAPSPMASRPAASMFDQVRGAPSPTASARTAAAPPPVAADADESDPAPLSTPAVVPTVMDASSATQAIVSALGGLIEAVGVDTSVQAMPAPAAPSLASGVGASSGASASDEATDTEIAEREPTSAHDTDATGEREPLRVHAEWSDAGVRVWLGADAQGLAAVDAVTRQLQQWLRGQGTRLLGVVCNGLQVWSPDRDGDAAAPLARDADTRSQPLPAVASDARGLPYQPTFP